MKQKHWLVIVPVVIISCVAFCPGLGKINHTASATAPDTSLSTPRIRQKAIEAKSYCKAHKMNTSFCLLIDMSRHSGKKRFFVWDFKNDSVIHSFLVGHGCCDNPWSRDASKDCPSFSNEDGSHCSSLGKYSIGERAYSEWGIHVKYLLHGLEKSNSNALARMIVFHSWDAVSDEEIYPAGTSEGWGCPTISDNSMRIMDPMLQQSQKPVLMWIYR
jgi:hypothetical protein